MGLLFDGRWVERWYDTSASGGRFIRRQSAFRNWITPNTQARKRLRERRVASLRHGIVFVALREHADPPHAVALLRARREWPHRRAADKRD